VPQARALGQQQLVPCSAAAAAVVVCVWGGGAQAGVAARRRQRGGCRGVRGFAGAWAEARGLLQASTAQRDTHTHTHTRTHARQTRCHPTCCPHPATAPYAWRAPVGGLAALVQLPAARVVAAAVAALAHHPRRQRPQDALEPCEQRRQRVVLRARARWRVAPGWRRRSGAAGCARRATLAQALAHTHERTRHARAQCSRRLAHAHTRARCPRAAGQRAPGTAHSRWPAPPGCSPGSRCPPFAHRAGQG
jgi:hypothetical protein